MPAERKNPANSEGENVMNSNNKVEQLMKEATRANGKCLISREEAIQMLQPISASHTTFSGLQATEPTAQHDGSVLLDCNRRKPSSIEVQGGALHQVAHVPTPSTAHLTPKKRRSPSRLRDCILSLIVRIRCFSSAKHPGSERERPKYHNKKRGQ